jgi:membrane associated rhomboid family serine protease
MTDLESKPAREPLFNAPWTVTLLVALLVASFLGQGLLTDARFYAWTLRPAAVLAGDPTGLVTSLFLHGGWAHVLMNAAFCLAFGAPVARFLGTNARGASVSLLFYMTCGVLAGLGYVALHPGGETPVVGASGAVAGLMGAAARLIDGRRWYGREVLGPVRSKTVGSLALSWVIVNLLVGLFGFPGDEGAKIAWEPHIAGFAAGLFLIGPFSRLATGVRPIDSTPRLDDAP